MPGEPVLCWGACMGGDGRSGRAGVISLPPDPHYPSDRIRLLNDLTCMERKKNASIALCPAPYMAESRHTARLLVWSVSACSVSMDIGCQSSSARVLHTIR